MKRMMLISAGLVLVSAVTAAAQGGYDAALAKKVGADKYGMKSYVLVILKTGPRDAEVKGKDRDDLFAAHMANIRRLASEGKLVLAGPFGQNGETFRGLFIFNTASLAEAKAWVATDPTVKAGVLVPDFVPWYGTAALMQVNELHAKIQQEAP
ncbi:MAG: YciI family protein [Pyrinomonadaceae bacterium]